MQIRPALRGAPTLLTAIGSPSAVPQNSTVVHVVRMHSGDVERGTPIALTKAMEAVGLPIHFTRSSTRAMQATIHILKMTQSIHAK